MFNKLHITQQVLAGLPRSEQMLFTVDKALQAWWINFRDGGGMRLTDAGYHALCTCDFATYTFEVPAGLPGKPGQLLTLDRKLDCPYFIKTGRKPQIILFGSRQAVMAAMYGDIEKFLNYLNRI